MGDRGYDSKASLSVEGLSRYRDNYDAIRWGEDIAESPEDVCIDNRPVYLRDWMVNRDA